jgi:cellobiose epimerase
MEQILYHYKQEMREELQRLLQYWEDYTLDDVRGGFIGKVDAANVVHPEAPKGAVLNARILWSFAAAFRLTGEKRYRELADRAYQYIDTKFVDPAFGGVYWSVDCNGLPLDTKKQVYALSFTIYALAEYYQVTADEKALQTAKALYYLILKHAYDKQHGGFIEALTNDWKPITDFRLSSKDKNTPKSMNTHLHVLEAFTNLYRVWPDDNLGSHIERLIVDFEQHIIHPQTKHLQLFFDYDWTVMDTDVSFGHDIEASWLLLEAAEVLGNLALIRRTKETAVAIATAAAKGLDADGGLWYEADATYTHWVREKHWWPQSEGMVGFLNAYQLTGEANFLQQSLNCWAFVKKSLKDPQGEWFWGVDANGLYMNQDKAGFWKCPYHNTRACIEVIRRADRLLNKQSHL